MSKKNSKNRKELVKLARKKGYLCISGSKHIKVTTTNGRLVTTIGHNVSDILAKRIRKSIEAGRHF